MEELVLRCNNHSQTRGYCRAELRDVAIVTTCSHVLCRTCAQESGFLTIPLAQRHCPACKSALVKPDDAAQTVLNPSEEYKTSVLSGLDPSTIMECANRALCFWNYQSLQEIGYQKHMLSALTQKYSSLNTAMDKLVLEANSELDGMQAKVSTLHTSNVELQQRNTEYSTKDRERTKKFNDLRMMYDKLKQRYQAIVQTGPASASAQRAIQTLTDNIVPPRNSTEQNASITIPQSAGGYFSARKQADTGTHMFGSMDQGHHRTVNVHPYAMDTRARPPHMGIPPRQGVSPVSFNVSPSRRLSLPSPLRTLVQGANNSHSNSHCQAQSPGTAWTSQNRQQLPTVTKCTSQQGNAVAGYGGISTNMKIGSASAGDYVFNHLRGV